MTEQAREIARLKRGQPVAANGAGEESGPTRYRPAGVAAHRKRLGLSAESYGKLVGVTSQTVFSWEAGKRPRDGKLKALAAIRTMGKKAANERLAELAKVAARSRAPKSDQKRNRRRA